MALNTVSFKSADLEAKKLEKVSVEQPPKLDSKPDTVEISSSIKDKPVTSFWGSIGALIGGKLTLDIGKNLVALPLLPAFKKAGKFEGADAEAIKNAVKQTHVDSGLKEKGVRLRFLNTVEEKSKKVKLNPNFTKAKAPKGAKLRDLSFEKIYRSVYEFLFVNPVRTGNNAFFSPKDIKLPKITLKEFLELSKSGNKELLNQKMKDLGVFIKGNTVILPENKLLPAGFHELGHAMNYNLSKFGKILQKCRPVAMLGPTILGIYAAVTKKSKPSEENGELNGRQKTNNFIRNNAGKLAFLATTPMLIEEGMATLKGQKFAKKLLTPELAKKVFKGNAIAYLSYLSVGLLSALAVRTAVKIKDGSIAKKEEKIAMQEEITEKIKQGQDPETLLSKMYTYRS